MEKKFKSISILGSGWLGLPLIKSLVSMSYFVKASTTSAKRVPQLSALNAKPYIVDIDNISSNIDSFLNSKILLINITSKNIDSYKQLVSAIEKSTIEKVLFVSSTSVYDNLNKIIDESSANESTDKALFKIENLFKNCNKIEVTIIRFAGLINYERHPGRFFASGKVVKNPDSFVNLIHQDDCIEIIKQIVDQGIWGEVFNCCADTHPTRREYYTKAAESLKLKIPEFESPSSISYKIISNKKVKLQLDYHFLHADLMDIKYLLKDLH